MCAKGEKSVGNSSVPPQVSKVARDASIPLDVDSDHDIHGLRSLSMHFIKPELLVMPSKKERKNKLVNYEQTLSTLHARVKDLESKREKLKVSEAQLLQEIDSLKHDRAVVMTKVVPDAAMKLIQSDEMGILVAKLVKESMFHGRFSVLEEVANFKEPFVLEKMSGYRPSSKEEFDRAGDDLANASYPFLVELTVDPYAFMEQFLSKKPLSLRLNLSSSHSKPLSSKLCICEGRLYGRYFDYPGGMYL
nr:hypothetical protein [Tanacetum cinerariifolium]